MSFGTFGSGEISDKFLTFRQLQVEQVIVQALWHVAILNWFSLKFYSIFLVLL